MENIMDLDPEKIMRILWIRIRNTVPKNLSRTTSYSPFCLYLLFVHCMYTTFFLFEGRQRRLLDETIRNDVPSDVTKRVACDVTKRVAYDVTTVPNTCQQCVSQTLNDKEYKLFCMFVYSTFGFVKYF